MKPKIASLVSTHSRLIVIKCRERVVIGPFHISHFIIGGLVAKSIEIRVIRVGQGSLRRSLHNNSNNGTLITFQTYSGTNEWIDRFSSLIKGEKRR